MFDMYSEKTSEYIV